MTTASLASFLYDLGVHLPAPLNARLDGKPELDPLDNLLDCLERTADLELVLVRYILRLSWVVLLDVRPVFFEAHAMLSRYPPAAGQSRSTVT